MGEVRVGTASWTDRTLIDSGWYPPEADTPERRLRYYARQFGLVEEPKAKRSAPRVVTGALIGAGAMYLLEPQHGRQHREQVHRLISHDPLT